MSHANSPSLYEAFNARTLQPHEVAKSFIPSEPFKRLVSKNHTIVVGPRGSGKTTMFKMLQQPALESWDHPEADEYRKRVDYSSVYVGTDINWKLQVDSLVGNDFSENEKNIFSKTSFTTNVLHSLVSAMLHRLSADRTENEIEYRKVVLTSKKESEISKAIASNWCLDLTLPSLLSLKQSLSDRFNKIHILSSIEAHKDSEGRIDRLSEIEFLHLNYLDSVKYAIEVFDDAIDQMGARWALLFDEMELAPEWLKNQLLSSNSLIRSADERILFKLSISLYDKDLEFSNILSPMSKHDFDPIALWYPKHNDGFTFSNTLWKSILDRRNIKYGNPEDVLGSSIFDYSQKGKPGADSIYGKNSAHRRRFEKLQEIDESFVEYLASRDIDLSELDAGSETDRAKKIRKIIAIVAVREAYRNRDKKLRSRRNTDLYCGARTFFAMIESNPRWLIAISNKLLSKELKAGKIPESIQNEEIFNAAIRFMAMLKTIPCTIPEEDEHGENVKSVADLIETIGVFFMKKVILDDFSPEPPSSFVVDSKVSSTVIDLLSKALNVGAIIYVPNQSESILLDDLTGKRFRLCYLLSVIYKLPIRLGRAISLSSILSESKPSQKNEKSPPKVTRSLFDQL